MIKKVLLILLYPFAILFLLFLAFIWYFICPCLPTNSCRFRRFGNRVFRKYHHFSCGQSTQFLYRVLRLDIGSPLMPHLTDEDLGKLQILFENLKSSVAMNPRLGASQAIRSYYGDEVCKSKYHFNDVVDSGVLVSDHFPGYNFSTRELLALPSLWNFLAAADYESAASRILGGSSVYLSSINAWIVTHFSGNSVSEDLKEKIFSSAAQTYHFDYDLLHFCKVFVSLTDVALDDGPFEYVDYTLNPSDIPWPPRFPPYFYHNKRSVVLPRSLEAAICHQLGPFGTSLACPTLCIHRDGRPGPGRYRVVLQLEYASSPKLFSEPSYGLEVFTDVLGDLMKANDSGFQSFLQRKSFLLDHLSIPTLDSPHLIV